MSAKCRTERSKRFTLSFIQTIRNGLLIVFALLALVTIQRDRARAASPSPATLRATIGGVNLGDLTNYLVFVADGSGKAKIQSASDGYAGDWAVNGTVATEETSGSFGYAGTIYTNDTGASAFGGWQDILNNNVGQAFGSTGNVALINSLKTTLNNAFTTINALPATSGYSSVSASSLNGLNTTDGVATTYVINVTSFSSTPMRITGDPGDIFIMRWDTDANFSNGYQGQVKFSGGDGIIPLGGLSPANFIHVAGDINSSGGGSPPTDFNFPLGPRTGNGQGPLPTGASNWPSSQGGGFFTGYWLTTGAPTNPPDANHSVWWGSSSSTSNGRIVGGWYSLTDDFTWTSGTSGVYIGPLDYGDLPEPKYLSTRKTSGQSGPAHVITSKLYIGTVFASDIDSEGNGQPNATATGDNIVNVNDEQGVTFPTFLAGQSANVTVKATNSTGKSATLYGFIDWNYDGDFADTGESATVSVPNGTAGNVVLTFNVPAGANTANQLGARFRLSTASGLGATDSPGANGPIPAPDGEVEDYLVSVSTPTDYGDAPDTGAGTGVGNYNTTASDSGPSHVIVNNLRLGVVAPDADNGTLQSAAADVDDTNNTDDEDGVTTLPAVTTTSTSVPLTVSVFNNTGSNATVACWIDFNRDGDFTDTGERASATVSSSASQQNVNLTFTGFAAPTGGTSYLRCRLANVSGEVANPTGAANSGEVEDYALTIWVTPTYQLTKRLNTIDPLRNGENISFTIRITNTGTHPLTTVPLTDTYDITYLTYVSSVPQSDDNNNDGVINWSDLTGTPAGFGIDLAPNQSFEIVVSFVGIEDTTGQSAQAPCTVDGNTCNVASVSGVLWDPDGPGGVPEQGPLPPKSDYDDVQIIVPTAVALADRSASYDGAVQLYWRTVNESELLGFNLYRSENGGPAVRLNDTLLLAQRTGQSDGAPYDYRDAAVERGKRYSYRLELIGMNGAMGQSDIGAVWTGAQLFLPAVNR